MPSYGTLHSLHLLDEATYRARLQAVLSKVEGVFSNAYGDSKGIPSIGIGINLRQHLNEVLATFGLVTNVGPPAQRAAEMSYFNQIAAVIRGPWPVSYHPVHQDNALNAIMLARASDPALASLGTRPTTFVLTQSQITTLFNDIYPTILNHFNGLLPGFPPSNEKVALMSVDWAVSGHVIGPALLSAIHSGTRAEAWYEIRYRTNAEHSTGIAKRRYLESDWFGLYDAGPITRQKAVDVYEMFKDHKTDILNYERTYPHSQAQALLGRDTLIPTLDQFLTPARDWLVANYARGLSIDVENIAAGDDANLTVARLRSGGAMLIGTGGGQALTGISGKDTALLNLQGGANFISGGGDVTTYMVNAGAGGSSYHASDGRNTMVGGAGNDTFYIDLDHVDHPTVIMGGGGADTIRITGSKHLQVFNVHGSNVTAAMAEAFSQSKGSEEGNIVYVINPDSDDRIYQNGGHYVSAPFAEVDHNGFHQNLVSGNPVDLIWRIDVSDRSYAYRNGDVWYSTDPTGASGAAENPRAGFLSARNGDSKAEFNGFVNGDFGITLTGMGSASETSHFEYFWSGIESYLIDEVSHGDDQIAGDDFFSYTGLELADLAGDPGDPEMPGEMALMRMSLGDAENPLVGDEDPNLLDPAGTHDFVSGGGGGDTIVYNKGYGPVSIEEVDDASVPANTLQFGAGIDPEGVTVTGDGEGNIVLSLGGSDQIVLIGALNSEAGTTYGVQLVSFDGGPDWTYSDLLSRALAADDGEGSIAGDRTANTLDTEGKVAMAVGGGGGDTFVYELGYGSMTILEADGASSPTNALVFGAGIDPGDVTVSANDFGDVVLLLTDGSEIVLQGALASTDDKTFGVQQISFDDSTTWSYADLLTAVSTAATDGPAIYGDTSANSLDSAGLVDRVVGNGGGDTITYELGYGRLEIDEEAAAGSTDNVLAFGTGILPGDVTVSGAGDGNILLTLNDDDQILIVGALRSDAETSRGIQQITFTGGPTWDYSDLLSMVSTAVSGGLSIYGDTGADTLDAAGLVGYVNGGGGGDTFVYELGYGDVVVDETDLAEIPSNTIAFGTGILPGDVSVTGTADGDLVLALAGSDKITIAGALTGGGRGVQEVTFTDTTVWTYADLLDRALTASATNTELFGDGGANVIDSLGLAGFVAGGGGGDTFVYETGYGDLVIDETDIDGAPDNILALGAGIDPEDVSVSGTVDGDLVLTIGTDEITLKGALLGGNGLARGVQQVTFDGGPIWTQADLVAMAGDPATAGSAIFGDAGANYLDTEGLVGEVVGGGGGDTIFYDAGYGALTITEVDGSVVADNRLLFGAGVSPDSITLSDDGNGNIVLSLGGSDEITIAGALASDDTFATLGVQTIAFASGASWTLDQVKAFISGELDYSPDQGNILIDAAALPTSGAPLIALDPDVEPGDVTVTVGDDSLSLVLTMANGAQIVLANALDPDLGFDPEVAFDGGTTWTFQDMLDLSLIPSATNTRLVGTGAAETFDGEGFVRKITGRGGGDTFIYNVGYGPLLIDERDPSGTPANTLEFGEDIDADDVRVSADANGNILLTISEADRVTLKGALRKEDGLTAGVQTVEFTGGPTWTYADLLEKLLTPSASNRQLHGDFSANAIDTDGVANYAAGGGGDDVFVYERGYGALTIDQRDGGSFSQSTIAFGADIDPGDIEIIDWNWPDLVISLGDGDEITLLRQMDQDTPGVNYGVQRLLFQDTTVINLDFKMIGDEGANVLDGEGLAKIIEGGGGGDTFKFSAGYGSLTIREKDLAGGTANVLEFGAGILPGDVMVDSDGDGSLILYVGDDSVKLQDALLSDGQVAYGVQTIRFDDTTEWTYADLLDKVMTPSLDRDGIFGDATANVLDGEGTTSWISGGGGGDTIVYNDGYGDLTISEADHSEDPANRLVLGAGIDPGDVTVSATGSDIQLHLDGGSVITLEGALLGGEGVTYGIQSIEFDDSTIWTYGDLLATLLTPSPTNTTLTGDASANYFDGAGVANVIAGNGGGDVIAYNSGYGDLEIQEYDNATSPNNILQLGAGILPEDVTVRFVDGDMLLHLTGGDTITVRSAGYGISAGVQSIAFDNGTIWDREDMWAQSLIGASDNSSLYGRDVADMIDPNGEADYVNGGGGNDRILYNSGYGEVLIDEFDGNARADNRLILGAGLTTSGVTVTADGSNVVLDFGGGDIVTLQSQLQNGEGQHGVQKVVFDNGAAWTSADLWAKANVPTIENPYIEGTERAETLDSLGIATFVSGGGGGDTIVYNLGYGPLELSEFNQTERPNTLAFGAGISPLDVTVTFGGESDLILTLAGTDEIVLDQAMLSSAYITNGVDRVTFDGGETVWTHADLVDMANTPSVSNQELFGDYAANSFDPLGIANHVSGRGGGDTIIYNFGYGALLIDEPQAIEAFGDPDNVLRLGAGILPSAVVVRANEDGDTILDMGSGDVITITGSHFDNGGVQQVVFDDDTIWDQETMRTMALTGSASNTILYGTFHDDVIDGNGFAHEVHGFDGADTYIFESGDGPLSISDSQAAGTEVNTLAFGTGILPGSVSLSVTFGGDLQLDLGSGDVVTLVDSWNSDDFTVYGVQQVTFADSTVWSDADMFGTVIAAECTSGDDDVDGSYLGDTIDAGAGNDEVNGHGGNDTITGGTGDDILIGGGGADTFIYNVGDGDDVISDFSEETGILQFGAGILPSDVVIGPDPGSSSDVRISFIGYAGSITLIDKVISTNWGPQEIHFDDNTVWTEADMLERFVAGQSTSGADTIVGTYRDDLVVAGAGNDTINSGIGDDTIEGGAGDDTVNGSFGTDIARYAGDQADYTLVTSGGSIHLVDDQPSTDGDDGTDTLIGIETLEFKGNVQVSLASPIVLDLGGDGVSLIRRDMSNISFDWDGDGVANRTGWVGANDGILVFDRNGDGSVSGAGEISFVQDRANSRSDLDGLQAFDSNDDGIFSNGDTAWSSFRIWVDRNSDAKSDAGEMLSMEEAGVSSISLGGAATERRWAWGENLVINTGTFTRTDGSLSRLADVALSYAADETVSEPVIEPRMWGGPAIMRFPDRPQIGSPNDDFRFSSYAPLEAERGSDGDCPAGGSAEQVLSHDATYTVTGTLSTDFGPPDLPASKAPVMRSSDLARQLVEAGAAFGVRTAGSEFDFDRRHAGWRDMPMIAQGLCRSELA